MDQLKITIGYRAENADKYSFAELADVTALVMPMDDSAKATTIHRILALAHSTIEDQQRGPEHEKIAQRVMADLAKHGIRAEAAVIPLPSSGKPRVVDLTPKDDIPAEGDAHRAKLVD